MKTSYNCVPCFFRQIEHTISFTKIDSAKKAKLIRSILKQLAKFNFALPPTVFGRIIYKTITKHSGVKDIFVREKINAEKQLEKYSAWLIKLINQAKDPLHAAARFACAANTIDFGAGRNPDLAELLEELRHIPLTLDHYHIFKAKLKKAKLICFLGDNCGETFFDRFFIQTLKRYYPKLKAVYAVRSAPIINDAVLADAYRVGLNKVATVMPSGSDCPGLLLTEMSDKFRKIYRAADIIVSKGQGNFESLEDNRKDIFYLFKTKCPTVSQYLDLPLNALLFIYNKHIKYKKLK